MHLHRPLLTAAVLLAGVALAQSSGSSTTPSYPTTNPTPNSTGSTSTPPGSSGMNAHVGATPGTAPMTPPTSSAMGTTPSPDMILGALHAANQSEVDLGKLAEQKAQAKDVKAFGKHMVKAHTGMDKDAQKWAKKNNVTIGTPPAEDVQKAQDTKQRLEGLSGAEFDKAYMQAMAEDHASDLSKVQTFEQQTTNKSLQKLLKKAGKEIASHKKDADRLVQKLGATAVR